jgi:hypothetical protein
MSRLRVFRSAEIIAVLQIDQINRWAENAKAGICLFGGWAITRRAMCMSMIAMVYSLDESVWTT